MVDLASGEVLSKVLLFLENPSKNQTIPESPAKDQQPAEGPTKTYQQEKFPKIY
jgi:hypothetical protein